MRAKLLSFVFIIQLASNFGILSSKAETLSQEDSTPTAPVVKIVQGELQGTTAKSRNGAEYYAYWGIPYAKPPERFQPPEPPSTPEWEGVKNATVPGSACVHVGYFDGEVLGSEDCLLLNVFTTSVYVEDEKEDIRPVIVYIHGGGFRTASSDMFGADYFMDESVVLVTINYRLSSLGFLNIRPWSENNNETVPNPPGVAQGNMGLKDQTMALRWIQDNIKMFGGDPDKVTLFGTSAGAASVSFHILSPMSKGLFHNAIAASGTALCPWALSRTPEFYAKELGKGLNCSISDSNKLIACLLEKDPKTIISHSRISTVWPLDPIGSFRPTIETTVNNSEGFLTEEPEQILRRGEYNKVPFLVGITKDEGLSLHAGRILSNPLLTKELNDNWNEIAPFTFTYQTRVSQLNWDAASAEIRSFYFGTKNISLNESLEELENVYTDRNFAHSVRAAILYQAKDAPVFPYIFGFDNGEHNDELFPGLNTSGKILHGDDSDYAFSDSLNPNNTEANEFSKKYVKVLVSFATTGKPDASILGTADWPQTSPEEANQIVPLQWFHIDNVPSLQNETETFTRRMLFWDELMKNYTRSA